jgi:hypothetical protein
LSCSSAKVTETRSNLSFACTQLWDTQQSLAQDSKGLTVADHGIRHNRTENRDSQRAVADVGAVLFNCDAVTQEQMTLRSYLIPQAFPESRIPLICTVDDNTVPSTATHSFSPPLHLPDRIPFQISLDSELPCKIHALLSELLSSDQYNQVANAPATNHLIRNYGTLQDFCERHRFHVSGH